MSCIDIWKQALYSGMALEKHPACPKSFSLPDISTAVVAGMLIERMKTEPRNGPLPQDVKYVVEYLRHAAPGTLGMETEASVTEVSTEIN